jgi:hypothetical protein
MPPFVQSLLPEFTAAGAIVTLNIALTLVENGSQDIDGLSPQDKLSRLQGMQTRLSSITKDQCAEAYAKLGHLNNPAYFDQPSVLRFRR